MRREGEEKETAAFRENGYLEEENTDCKDCSVSELDRKGVSIRRMTKQA